MPKILWALSLSILGTVTDHCGQTVFTLEHLGDAALIHLRGVEALNCTYHVELFGSSFSTGFLT